MERLFCPENNAVFMKLFLAVAVLYNISLSENYSFFQKYFRSFDKMHSEVILQQKNIELKSEKVLELKGIVGNIFWPTQALSA